MKLLIKFRIEDGDYRPRLDDPSASQAMKMQTSVMTHQASSYYHMTPEERQNPSILNGSRRRRIATGSGTTVREINDLMKQFEQMKKMMKTMSKMGKMGRAMQGLKNLPLGR